MENLISKGSEVLQEKQSEAKKFVAYYRVSTKKQGISGLGLEAQQIGVHRFVASCGGILQSEYTEIVSGSLSASKRTHFQRAVNECIKTGATLVVFKLDRLGRNLINFLNDVVENKNLSFAIAEKGKAYENVKGDEKMMLQFEMIIAERERERISERTKQAIDAKRKRGENVAPIYKLTANDRAKAGLAMKESALENENNKNAYAFASALYKSGVRSFAEIANELNNAHLKTARKAGAKWEKSMVKRLFSLYANSETRFNAFEVVQNKPTNKKELIALLKRSIETENKPYNEVARLFNELGLKTKNGAKWYAQTIKREYEKIK